MPKTPTAKIKLRRIKPKDVVSFLPVIRKLRTKLTKQTLRIRLKLIKRIPGHFFWGISRNKEKIGFCHASIGINFSAGGRDLYLNDLIIVEQFRSNGLGAKILQDVSTLARQRKCKRILVTVRTNNVKAIRFYCRRGFQRKGWSRLVKKL